MSVSTRRVIITAPHEVCIRRGDGIPNRDCDRRAFQAATRLYKEFRTLGVPTVVFYGNEYRSIYDLNRSKEYNAIDGRTASEDWHETLKFELAKTKEEYTDSILIDVHSFPSDYDGFDVIEESVTGAKKRLKPKIVAMIRANDSHLEKITMVKAKSEFQEHSAYIETVLSQHEPSNVFTSSEINHNISLAKQFSTRAILLEFCEDKKVLSDSELERIVRETADHYKYIVTGKEISQDILFLFLSLVIPITIKLLSDYLELSGFLAPADKKRSRK